ncbi:tRNA pseudouridine(55) synthase TruB [Roseateles sp.]|uniref:tRNA pseudouridine(55) synthase TruB n=1 Tax=Roseateles sp. TaxID=1971397 RepID=UPI0025E986A5|nr:tRNA pseudouridine(55) synthase TruB [Roseateles sp.]MBV8036465.1 tRNA pseudouridine(55) synthase TruB [Roseateles sp.]
MTEATVAARPPRVRIQRRPLHGVLLLDKPLGLSSNDALQKAKWLLRAEKAGHTGTLDPLATGLLPLCFGAATKFSQLSLDADKRYLATLALGIRTTTGDAEGEVLERLDADHVTREQIEAASRAFVGEIDQMPPMYSALKHEGKALYEYARQGIEIERKSRRVTIHSIDIVAMQAGTVTLDVRCSKGTYIRTLAEDIGAALGVGASLAALRRTGSGGLTLDGAVTLSAIEAMPDEQRAALLTSPDRLLADAPELRLNMADATRFLSGLRRRVDVPDAERVRVYGPEAKAFLGSAHITSGELIADRLLTPPEVQALISA